MMKRIRLAALSFRGSLWLLALPLVVMFLVVPGMCMMMVAKVGAYQALLGVVNRLQTFIPVFVVCWQMGFLREQLEQEGNEVLFVYQHSGRSRLAEVLTLAGVYALGILGVLGVLDLVCGLWLFPVMALRLAVQSLFFSALFYALACVTRNIGMALLVVLVYYFVAAFYSVRSELEWISVFCFATNLTIPRIGMKDLTAALLSVAFLYTGHRAIKGEMK